MIVEIEITDFKAVSSLVMRPGTLTVIHGANETGKTSIMDALRFPFEGGHDPAVIRHGAKRAVVQFVLEDGTKFVKTTTPKASTLEVYQPDGRRVEGGDKTYLNQLASALAVDPAKLLMPNLKPKEIAERLLDVLHISYSIEEVRAAVGSSAWVDVRKVPAESELTLDQVADIHRQLYDSRRLANRADRDAEGTVTDLVASLPQVASEDIRPAMEASQARLTEVEALTRAELAKVAEIERQELTTMRDEYDRRAAELEAWKSATWADIQTRTMAARAAVEAEARPHREALQAEIAGQRKQLEEWARAKTIEEQIAKHRTRAREHALRSLDLTNALERLDALRKSRLDSLPIPGLEYREGEFFVDGVPWQHVNTAKRTYYACEIAALRAGTLRFLCLDDAEHLDAETMKGFHEWAKEKKYQVIATRVNDVPLTVEVSS